MGKDQKAFRNRKGVYNPQDDPFVAKKLRELGATDNEIAAALKISRDELASWQSEHSDFHKACAETSQTHDARLDRALLKLATGFIYKRNKPVNCNGILVVVTYEVYAPPNLEAMKLWFAGRSSKNRIDEITRGYANYYLRTKCKE